LHAAIAIRSHLYLGSIPKFIRIGQVLGQVLGQACGPVFGQIIAAGFFGQVAALQVLRSLLSMSPQKSGSS
jgi:hypothetical protein